MLTFHLPAFASGMNSTFDDHPTFLDRGFQIWTTIDNIFLLILYAGQEFLSLFLENVLYKRAEFHIFPANLSQLRAQ